MRNMLALIGLMGFSSMSPADPPGLARITNDGSFKQHLQWSPDGSRIGVMRMTGVGFDARLVLIDVESGDEQVIEQELGRPGVWSWSQEADTSQPSTVVCVTLYVLPASSGPLSFEPPSVS